MAAVIKKERSQIGGSLSRMNSRQEISSNLNKKNRVITKEAEIELSRIKERVEKAVHQYEGAIEGVDNPYVDVSASGEIINKVEQLQDHINFVINQHDVLCEERQRVLVGVEKWLREPTGFTSDDIMKDGDDDGGPTFHDENQISRTIMQTWQFANKCAGRLGDIGRRIVEVGNDEYYSRVRINNENHELVESLNQLRGIIVQVKVNMADLTQEMYSTNRKSKQLYIYLKEKLWGSGDAKRMGMKELQKIRDEVTEMAQITESQEKMLTSADKYLGVDEDDAKMIEEEINKLRTSSDTEIGQATATRDLTQMAIEMARATNRMIEETLAKVGDEDVKIDKHEVERREMLLRKTVKEKDKLAALLVKSKQDIERLIQAFERDVKEMSGGHRNEMLDVRKDLNSQIADLKKEKTDMLQDHYNAMRQLKVEYEDRIAALSAPNLEGENDNSVKNLVARIKSDCEVQLGIAKTKFEKEKAAMEATAQKVDREHVDTVKSFRKEFRTVFSRILHLKEEFITSLTKSSMKEAAKALKSADIPISSNADIHQEIFSLSKGSSASLSSIEKVLIQFMKSFKLESSAKEKEYEKSYTSVYKDLTSANAKLHEQRTKADSLKETVKQLQWKVNDLEGQVQSFKKEEKLSSKELDRQSAIVDKHKVMLAEYSNFKRESYNQIESMASDMRKMEMEIKVKDRDIVNLEKQLRDLSRVSINLLSKAVSTISKRSVLFQGLQRSRQLLSGGGSQSNSNGKY